LDWRAKVELFEQIRREYEFGIGTIAGVAKKVGVHRREAIGSALPKPRKKTERPRWKLKAAVEFIDAILEGDRKAPRKQRHTALTEKQRKAMLPYKPRVGEIYRMLDWLRDTILNENRDEFDRALESLHRELAELEARVSF
jgi:hypothetical protein